jgi:hypothetical protein
MANIKMKNRKIINIFLVLIFLSFIPGTHLISVTENNWPDSFEEFTYLNTKNNIENIFEDDPTKYFFNKGYNPNGDKYRPIPSNIHNKFLDKLKSNLNKGFSDSTGKLKNCSAFNNLFDKMIKKNLPKIPETLCISNQIAGDGTINNMGFFLHSKYFNNYIYHFGKQLREIENGQRDDFNITVDHFDIDRIGNKEGNPIKTNLGHELLHHLSGFNGGGLEAECIVHCLTKKCIDPDHNFTELAVGGIGGQEVGIDCYKIEGTPGKVGVNVVMLWELSCGCTCQVLFLNFFVDLKVNKYYNRS